MPPSRSIAAFSCFEGHRCIANGELPQVALALRARRDEATANALWVFDNDSGQTLDIDTRGSEQELLQRLAARSPAQVPAEPSAGGEAAPAPPRGRGRPKLGVVAKEVTLLPRHWEWLATQPGGASVALRKLVEEARRSSAGKDLLRKAAERAYHFMSAIGGDLPGFEEASRALFAHDRDRFAELIANWPTDIRDHATALAFAADAADTADPH